MKWPLIAAITVVLTILTAAGHDGLPSAGTPARDRKARRRNPQRPRGKPCQPAPAAGQSVLPFSELDTPTVWRWTASAMSTWPTQVGVGCWTGGGLQQLDRLPFTGLGKPSGVAVDAARTVYVTNVGNNQVLDLAAGCQQHNRVAHHWARHPLNRASCGSGYRQQSLHRRPGNRVLKLAAGSANPVPLPFTDLSNPSVLRSTVRAICMSATMATIGC